MFLQKAWRTAAFGLYGLMHFTKSGFEKHSRNFRAEDLQARIEGKNCLVTGANSGLGYVTAEALASRGATVYLVCRSKERGEAACSKIRAATGNANVYLEVCDLSSVGEIKSFASKFSSKELPLHILVNNAGSLEQNRVTTSERLELNFAINVVGTYSMTESILPLLEKTAPDARVITVSSGGMYTAPLSQDLQFSESNFNGTEQYARNKRVQHGMLYTIETNPLQVIRQPIRGVGTHNLRVWLYSHCAELQKHSSSAIKVALTEKWSDKYGSKGIGFYSMHPGWADTPGVAKSLPDFSQRMSGKLRTSEEGADTIIWLALQPKEKLVSGAFYFDRAEAPKHLPFAGTAGSHVLIGSIYDSLQSLCNLPK